MTVGKITFHPVTWNDFVSRHAEKIPFDYAHLFRDFFRREVEAKRQTACTVNLNGKPIGAIFYQIETNENLRGKEIIRNRELVITGIHCDNQQHPLVNFLDGPVTQLMKSENCLSMRFHTQRPALVLAAERRGWRVSEIILRKDA